jgi:hypothetical protein
MKIQHVNLSHVNQTWPYVEKFIEMSLAYQEDYNIEHAKVLITNGAWTLIVAVDDTNEIHGAAAITFYNRPQDRVAFVIAMGGKLITGQDTYAQFAGVLKAFGATYIEGASRESATRLWERFGLKEKYRISGAKL